MGGKMDTGHEKNPKYTLFLHFLQIDVDGKY